MAHSLGTRSGNVAVTGVSLAEKPGKNHHVPRGPLGRVRRITIGLATCATLATFVLHFAPAVTPTWWAISTTIASPILWVSVVVLSYVYLGNQRRKRPSARPIPFSQSDFDRWDSILSPDLLVFLIQMFYDPQANTRRVSEHVGFLDKSLVVKTSLTIDVPPELFGAELLIPVYEEARGQLVDGLHVKAGANKRLSTLTQHDTSHILMVLFARIVQRLEPSAPRPGGTGRAFRDWETQVAVDRADISRQLREIVRGTNAAKAVRQFDRLVSPHGTLVTRLSADEDTSKLLTTIALRVSENYPIVVPVLAVTPAVRAVAGSKRPSLQLASATLRIKLRHIEAMQSPPSRGLSRLVQVLMYVSPPRLNFSLRRADQARSYHLQIDAPNDMYFYELRTVPTFSSSKGGTPKAKETGRNVSGSHLQRSGHLYLRDARKLKGYQAEISFKERIPGSLGTAFVWTGLVSLLALAAILTRGLALDGLGALLVPALFFGLTTGSIWQGVTQLSEPFGGRFVSRLSSLVTVGVCIAAVIQSSLDLANSQLCNGCSGSSLSPGQMLSWAIIFGLTFTNTVGVAAYWLADTLVEQLFMREDGAK